ncbi:MAG: hypothetical protein ACOYN6_10120 [Ignavibacteria bacterium]
MASLIGKDKDEDNSHDNNKNVIFLKDIYKKIDNGNTHFDNCIFNNLSGNIGYYEANEHLDLGRMGFNQKADISFTNCIFNISVSFYEMVITCSEPHIFKNCIFNKTISFNNTTIEHISIEDCVFNSELIFYSCKEIKSININSTIFNGTFSFDAISAVRFTKIIEAEFNCNFNGKVHFKNVMFDYLDISNSIIGDKNFTFNSCMFNNIALFRRMNLKSNVVFINTDITNCSFLNSDFENVIFSSPTININNLVDLRLLNDSHEMNYDDLKRLGMYNADEIISVVTARSLIMELKTFEKNFDNMKQFDLAGEFHQRSMDVDREHNSKGLKYIILSLYKFFSDYGENYSKVGVWFFLIIILFSFLYLFSGLDYIQNDYHSIIFYLNCSNIYNFFNDFALSILYSTVNSFPVKRDIDFIKAANGFTVFWSSMQTIIQGIFITLFIIALRRKFKR